MADVLPGPLHPSSTDAGESPGDDCKCDQSPDDRESEFRAARRMPNTGKEVRRDKDGVHGEDQADERQRFPLCSHDQSSTGIRG